MPKSSGLVGWVEQIPQEPAMPTEMAVRPCPSRILAWMVSMKHRAHRLERPVAPFRRLADHLVDDQADGAVNCRHAVEVGEMLGCSGKFGPPPPIASERWFVVSAAIGGAIDTRDPSPTALG